jgi:hypothetical protein
LFALTAEVTRGEARQLAHRGKYRRKMFLTAEGAEKRREGRSDPAGPQNAEGEERQLAHRGKCRRKMFLTAEGAEKRREGRSDPAGPQNAEARESSLQRGAEKR